MTARNISSLLVMAEYHLSLSKAQALVIELLKAMGAQKPDIGWEKGTYTLQTSKKNLPLNFKEMVTEARLTGIVKAIHGRLDGRHRMFGGTLGLATNSQNITLGMTFAGYSQELRGPSMIYPVEKELAEDIMFFRRMACTASASTSFTETARYFRSYLFCCVALIDAFVNRYIHLGKYKKISHPDFELLASSTNTEERLVLWAKIFANTDAKILKEGAPWDHFKRIHKARNIQVHAMEPYYAYKISEISDLLNSCREGIGGLLAKMQKLDGSGTYSPFERLRTAPIVRHAGSK